MTQETLGIEVPAHPMTIPPDPDAEMPSHLRNLLVEIARKSTALDGRPDYQETLEYLREVYSAALAFPTWSRNFMWLMGMVQWQRFKAVDKIDQRLDGLTHGDPTPLQGNLIAALRRHRAAIVAYAEIFEAAIVRDIRIR